VEISYASGTCSRSLPLLALLSLRHLRNRYARLVGLRGRTSTFENRFGEGNLDRLPDLAAELVSLNVDVIVSGSTPAALATKNATRTIPIVMITTADPVTMGIVASLARPGANVTGVTFLGQELAAKRLELLKESVPGVTTVAVLSDPNFPETASAVKAMPGMARALGVQLQVHEILDPLGFEKAFTAMKSARAGAGALLVLTSIMFLTHRRRIVDLATRNRLPTMYPLREYMDAGALMFYGVSLPDVYRLGATYVDKILRGAKPADLPVQQYTKFELVINRKTAKAVGLTIPPTLLLRADQIIE
jgi:putative ABC transport system substrate-binding protein